MRLELPCTSKTIITYLEFLVQSVQNNAALSIRITGVFSVPMLRKLIRAIQKYADAKLYTALFLTAFFGFFRLASLLPNAIGQFDKT